jgi:hypothetical protein
LRDLSSRHPGAHRSQQQVQGLVAGRYTWYSHNCRVSSVTGTLCVMCVLTP